MTMTEPRYAVADHSNSRPVYEISRLSKTYARNQLVAFPERTIASIKRKMGTMDPVKMGEQSFTPIEISAMILRRLREQATEALGVPVSRAVITVPAFFDENQRQATRAAGELAGLTVERIINEPTAATLVYHAGSDARKHIVVYDLGGGTFDVSLVRIESGVVEVLSSRGDTQLGGDDFDAALMKYVADQFYDEHEIDLRQDASSRWRLLTACEAAKCRLSREHEVVITEEFIAEKDGQPINLNVSITRELYEGLIAESIDQTIRCIDEAMIEASLNLNQIDELVLVGGSTRTPLVEARLREEFALEPSRAVDADLAVALGAATQAAMISGQTVGPVLVDVVTHTLGIEALVDMNWSGPVLRASPIIRRGSALPATYESAYSAVHDEQKIADVHILQGEHEDVDKNETLGHIKLDLVNPTGSLGEILVRFDLSISGMLKVTARQKGNFEPQELTIENALARFDAEDSANAETRLDRLFEQTDPAQLTESEKLSSPSGLRVDDSEEHSPTTSATPMGTANLTLAKARSMAAKLAGDDSDDLADLADQLQVAINDADEQAAIDLCAEIDDVLFYVQQ